MKRILLFAVVLFALSSCGGNGSTTTTSQSQLSDGVNLSEREEYRYNKALADVEAIEALLQAGEQSAEGVAKLQQRAKALNYEYNAEGMNAATVEHCEQLRQRIEALQDSLKNHSIKAQTTVRHINIVSHSNKLLSESVTVPFYAEAGEVVVIEHSASEVMTVRLNNADIQRTLKRYNSKSVNDSIKIEYSGVYTIDLEPTTKCYSSLKVSTRGTKLARKIVRSEQVKCNKGDWGAKAVQAINMHNCFEQPYKFTLRGQLKATFSGNSAALVAVHLPAGTTDVLYSMRIATSESSRAEDGQFHDNLSRSYKRVKFLGLPLYEKSKSNGLLNTLLDDNRPVREEDAYCNMYVFRSQSQAKQFQDGSKSASQLNYDIDYSTIGTQSRNGRIAANGAKVIYLGFENERVRYNNYLWVEAVAVVATTEYYTTKYSVQ